MSRAELRSELKRLGVNAAVKRKALLKLAEKNAKKKNTLVLFSGIVTLLSATLIAGATIKYIHSDII